MSDAVIPTLEGIGNTRQMSYMGTVKIEIWAFPGEKDNLRIGEQIREGMSFFDLFVDLAERHEVFAELGFNSKTKGFFPHVVVLLNGGVTGTTALLAKQVEDGDMITILPYVIGG